MKPSFFTVIYIKNSLGYPDTSYRSIIFTPMKKLVHSLYSISTRLIFPRLEQEVLFFLGKTFIAAFTYLIQYLIDLLLAVVLALVRV